MVRRAERLRLGSDGRLAGELATGGASAEVGQHEHAHQRPQQGGEGFVAAGEQPGVQDGEDRAHDAFGGDLGRFLGRTSDTGAGARAALVDDLLDLGQDLSATFEHAGARRQRLDDADPGESGLVVHEPQQREQAGAHALAPVRLSLVGLGDERAQLVDGLVEGCEEAILAIFEEVVERLAGDPRTSDHLGDGQPGITDFLNCFHRGREHPAALDLRNLSARQSIGTRTKPRGCRARLIL